jgi:hypothetical protein
MHRSHHNEYKVAYTTEFPSRHLPFRGPQDAYTRLRTQGSGHLPFRGPQDAYTRLRTQGSGHLCFEAVVDHPVIVEDLGEVTATRIGEDDNNKFVRVLLGNTERTDNCHATRTPNE